jgi:hypothetical protein
MKIFSCLLFFVFFTLNISAQNGNFITSDIDNFWNAYDKITATKDSKEQFEFINQLFIEKGSPGLKAMMETRRYTDKSYVDAINTYPKFWNSIRGNTLKAEDFARGIEIEVEKLKKIYPELRPAKVYFVVGAFRSSGTTQSDKILIGSEIALGDKSTVTDEFPDSMKHLKTYFANNSPQNIVFLNVHEYIHTQQKTTLGNNLLAQSVLEGVAEFVAVTATGGQPYSSIAFGKANESKVRTRFTTQIFNADYGFWLYDDDNNEFRVRDLGYYVGYAIAEKYYQKSADKKLAVKEMIELDYNNETELAKYVDKSGYFSKPVKELRKQYERSRPKIIGIKQLKNGSQTVSPNISQITVEFSTRMDTESRNRNFEIGPLGESNILRVKNFIGFSADSKSATFEVELKPNQRYQLILGERFRNADGVRLAPYLIDFKTANK